MAEVVVRVSALAKAVVVKVKQLDAAEEAAQVEAEAVANVVADAAAAADEEEEAAEGDKINTLSSLD